MLKLLILALAMFVTSAFSADQTGTWKLDTAKSKYTGVPAPKDMTVTYTPEGTGWRYEAKGTSGTDQPVNATFTYVKDNEEIKTTGLPYWDTLILRNGNGDKATGTLKRSGQTVGSVTRTMSADGKSMTVRVSLTLPDGKKANYTAVYDKQ